MSNNRSVLLINPSMGEYYRTLRVSSAISQGPPLNLAILAGALSEQGHPVEVIDLVATPQAERTLGQQLDVMKPELVGISIRSPVFREACRLAGRVRRLWPRALRVAGGVHPSVLPAEVVEGPFNVAVIGEGEETVVALAGGGRLSDVEGIAFRREGEVVRSRERGRVTDLDRLPMPDWERFDLRRYGRRSLVAPHPPVADLESSRGCPARCVYCTRVVLGERFRAKSPERVLEEVLEARRAGFRSFNFVDDCFTTDLERAIRICELLIQKGLRMPWTLTNGIRVSHASREFFEVAARAGLELVAFGLETGSQELLDLVGKGTTLDQARRAVRNARACGIATLGFFMVGLPGERRETLEATLEFANSLDLDYAKFSITVPLPGTALHDSWKDRIDPTHCHEMNIHVPNRDFFSHPDLEWDEVERFLERAYRRFYFRPGYVARRIVRDLARGNLMYNSKIAIRMRL